MAETPVAQKSSTASGVIGPISNAGFTRMHRPGEMGDVVENCEPDLTASIRDFLGILFLAGSKCFLQGHVPDAAVDPTPSQQSVSKRKHLPGPGATRAGFM